MKKIFLLAFLSLILVNAIAQSLDMPLYSSDNITVLEDNPTINQKSKINISGLDDNRQWAYLLFDIALYDGMVINDAYFHLFGKSLSGKKSKVAVMFVPGITEFDNIFWTNKPTNFSDTVGYFYFDTTNAKVGFQASGLEFNGITQQALLNGQKTICIALLPANEDDHVEITAEEITFFTGNEVYWPRLTFNVGNAVAIKPSADATINNINPDVNYSDGNLKAYKDADEMARSLIKFDISPLWNIQLSHIQLNVRAKAYHSTLEEDFYDVYLVPADTGWKEEMVTWNNAPLLTEDTIGYRTIRSISTRMPFLSYGNAFLEYMQAAIDNKQNHVSFYILPGKDVPSSAGMWIAEREVGDGYMPKLYAVAQNQSLAAPKFSPAEGEYTGQVQVEISSPLTFEDEIYFTTDGTIPDIDSEVFPPDGLLSDTSFTLNAITCRGLSCSNPVSIRYEIRCPQPVLFPVDTIQSGAFLLTMDVGSPDAHIYYTTDGSMPDATDSLYNAPLIVEDTIIIKVIVLKEGCLPGNVLTKTYYAGSRSGKPIVTPEPGLYINSVSVNMMPVERDAEIFYAINDDAFEPYDNSLKLIENSAIKFFAKINGKEESDTVLYNYLIKLSPPAYNDSAKKIYFSTSRADAEIYYFIDNGTNDTVFLPYTAPVNLTTNATVYAFASKENCVNSDTLKTSVIRNSFYKPRHNYDAKMEPLDKVISGAGQDYNGYKNFYEVMPEQKKPLIYMAYKGLKGMNSSDEFAGLRSSLKSFPAYVIPQIGVAMTHDGEPEKHYEHQVAAGDFDAEIQNLVNSLRNIGRPVYLRLGYEFNGQWNGYEPEPFAEAFRMVAKEIKKENLDVAMVWCGSADAPFTNFMDYYPGDEYVDWFGVDIFVAPHFTSPWTKAMLDSAHAHQKPVLIGESTPRNTGTLEGKDSWYNWFEGYFKFIQENAGIKMFSYINWNWNETRWDWGDCRIEINEYVTNRFKGEMDSAFYLHATLDEEAYWEAMGDTVVIINSSFESKAPGVVLFPNPFSADRSFSVYTVEKASHFALKDIIGKDIQINFEKIDDTRARIKVLSTLPQGVYILEVYYASGGKSGHRIMVHEN